MKAREAMSNVKYLDFTDEELMEIREEYKTKVEPFLNIVAKFRLPTKSATKKEVRSALRISNKRFELMCKVFDALKDALDAKGLSMKMKSELDLQKAIVASEYKNAKMIEMQLKLYNDEYNKSDEQKINVPEKIEFSFVDTKETDEELDGYVKDLKDRI